MEIKIGSKIYIKNDWLPAYARKCVATVDKCEKYGRIDYVRVTWEGKNSAKLTENCGTLFPFDEVILI